MKKTTRLPVQAEWGKGRLRRGQNTGVLGAVYKVKGQGGGHTQWVLQVIVDPSNGKRALYNFFSPGKK